MPTINLLTGNAEKLEKKLTIDSLVFGKGKGKYKFDGVDKVKSLTPITQEPNTYNPNAEGSRFGALTEVEDDAHVYELTEGPSNNMSIDKSYNTAQLMLKRASEIMDAQIKEQYLPLMDRAALTAKVEGAGAYATDGTISDENVFAKLTAARKAFVNNKVAGDGKDLVCWASASVYDHILNDTRFKTLQELGQKATTTGVVGKLAGFQIIEVPDDYFEDDNVNFVCANLNLIIDVDKFRTLRILTEHPDVDGAVLQPHFKFGSFVNQANNKGCYVSYIEAPSV